MNNLKTRDRIMGHDLYSGGHLTHGLYTSKRKVSSILIFCLLIDYDGIESLAVKLKPKLLVCGYSAYSRDLDYEKFRTFTATWRTSVDLLLLEN